MDVNVGRDTKVGSCDRGLVGLLISLIKVNHALCEVKFRTLSRALPIFRSLASAKKLLDPPVS